MIKLKSDLVTLIAEKLGECNTDSICAILSLNLVGQCVGQQVRMFYKDFDRHITSKYGVVCRSWPLPQFQSPADMSTKNEVEIVMHAFKTGVTSFQRLSDADWRAWSEARFQAALEEQMGPHHQPEGEESRASGDRDIEMENSTSGPQAGPSIAPATGGVLQPSQVPNIPSAVSTNGGMVINVSSQKQRKKRSDAGISRGPRRKSSVQ